jgi:alkylation response protein AidB-like acyl-CoA dehydrogenase
MSLFATLLTRPLPDAPVGSLDAWWAGHLALRGDRRDRVAIAAEAGLAADRVGWAFASGYQEALAALVPGLSETGPASLCVTEAGGNTPRAIAARLVADGEGFVLEGDKKWTTLGPASTTLLVAARVDAPGATRPVLRVVRVDARAPGVTITPHREAPFVPEIPHASVALRAVRVRAEDVLEGDGYDRYVKPFRTIEDLHVTAALLGHAVRLLRAERDDEARASLEDALATVGALVVLAERPGEPATHVALAGALRGAERVYEALDRRLAAREDEVATRWRRDRALARVAAGARAQRAARAWESLG